MPVEGTEKAPDQGGRVRFGPFELRLEAGELYKEGIRLKLAGQAIEVLRMLLDRPGRLVTREELQKKLWSEAEFGDFEHGLNAAVNRLRESLADSATEPKYIETVPRRGYRFIGTIKQPGDPALPVPASPSTAASNPPKEGIWNFRSMMASAGILLILAAAVVVVLSRPLPPPKILGSAQITSDGRHKWNLYFTSVWGRLVTDGPRIYFSEVGARMQVSAEGGETATIPTNLPTDLLFDISPKGSELLVGIWAGISKESAFWVVPALGGSPRRLGDAQGHDGAWSPDGQQIVYAVGSDLYVLRKDGSENHKLVTSPGVPTFPRWSPDGKIIRFTVYDSQKNAYSLWEVSADSANLHPLLPGWNNGLGKCCGMWTPDGKYFIFQSSQGGTSNIWAIREKGGLWRKAKSQPVQLTAGPMNTAIPVVSRDGKKIFVVGELRRAELVQYDSNSRQLVPFLSGVSAHALDASRDGKRVVYVSFPDGALWRTKADGSDRLQLTFSPMKAYVPHWSPDGKWIAFMGQLPGKTWKTYTISVDGGSPQMSTPGERMESDPTWSPDGNSLVFGSQAFMTGEAVNIQILNLKNHQISTLPGSEGMYSPRWSPDGRYIAAMSTDSLKLVLFDFKTQKWTDLVERCMDYPTWSLDSKFIYFEGYTRPAKEAWYDGIYRVSIQERKVERVVSLEGVRQAVGDFGAWVGLGPDGSPVLARDAGSQDIYALDWEAP